MVENSQHGERREPEEHCQGLATRNDPSTLNLESGHEE